MNYYIKYTDKYDSSVSIWETTEDLKRERCIYTSYNNVRNTSAWAWVDCPFNSEGEGYFIGYNVDILTHDEFFLEMI